MRRRHGFGWRFSVVWVVLTIASAGAGLYWAVVGFMDGSGLVASVSVGVFVFSTWTVAALLPALFIAGLWQAVVTALTG